MNLDPFDSPALKPKGALATLDFCCGGKKCPVVIAYADGIVIRDDEQERPIEFTREQARELRKWLESKGF